MQCFKLQDPLWQAVVCINQIFLVPHDLLKPVNSVKTVALNVWLIVGGFQGGFSEAGFQRKNEKWIKCRD